MSDPLFILGVLVLGIPGVWPWLLAAPSRSIHFMAGCSEPPPPKIGPGGVDCNGNQWPAGRLTAMAYD